MRYKVIQFYYDEAIYPQYAVMDTKRKDTVRDYLGYTQILTASMAKWLCKELNNKDSKGVEQL